MGFRAHDNLIFAKPKCHFDACKWNAWSSMTGQCNAVTDRKLTTAGCASLVAALLLVGSAAAQEVPEQPEPPLARPGIFDVIERWFEDSKARIDNQVKGTQQAIEDAAKDAAKAGQAGGAMLGFPGSKVARGRVRCAVAPNGAPDCVEAANALCRSKGYGPGKSVEINTADKCPTWVWLSGQRAPEGTCTTETFVLQATCQ
jgi:hypothetical protein